MRRKGFSLYLSPFNIMSLQEVERCVDVYEKYATLNMNSDLYLYQDQNYLNETAGENICS